MPAQPPATSIQMSMTLGDGPGRRFEWSRPSRQPAAQPAAAWTCGGFPSALGAGRTRPSESPGQQIPKNGPACAAKVRTAFPMEAPDTPPESMELPQIKQSTPRVSAAKRYVFFRFAIKRLPDFPAEFSGPGKSTSRLRKSPPFSHISGRTRPPPGSRRRTAGRLSHR